MSDSGWFYSNDGRRLGPVPYAELRRQANQGSIGPEDLIWNEGWSDWRPASQVEELKADLTKEPGPVNEVISAGVPVRLDPPSHFLDQLLDALRALFPQADFAETARLMAAFGRYSLYAAMLIGLAFSAIRAIKIDSLDVLFLGMGGVLVGLALQYAAVRLSQAVPGLIRATPTRMSSTAFLDSFAVILLIVGVVGLATSTLVSIRQESLNIFLIGVGLFLGSEQLALYCLRPGAMNIRITEDASCGEEAIGIISFFLMLPLRFVPTVFGVGTAVGTVGLLACLVLTLKGGESTTMAMDFAPAAVVVILGSAAFPLATYIYFIFYYLFIDVIRSILVLPSKLDRLSEGRQTTQDRDLVGR
jgi:hypothetical protein